MKINGYEAQHAPFALGVTMLTVFCRTDVAGSMSKSTDINLLPIGGPFLLDFLGEALLPLPAAALLGLPLDRDTGSG